MFHRVNPVVWGLSVILCASCTNDAEDTVANNQPVSAVGVPDWTMRPALQVVQANTQFPTQPPTMLLELPLGRDGAFVGYAEFANAPISAGWTPAATGDLDGDGESDILWKVPTQPIGFRYEYRIMKRTNVVDYGFGTITSPDWSLPQRPVDSAWLLSATADFDSDGNTDIMWVNKNTSEVEIWLYDRLRKVSQEGVLSDLTPKRKIPLTERLAAAVPNFRSGSNLINFVARTAGDANGDLYPDLYLNDRDPLKPPKLVLLRWQANDIVVLRSFDLPAATNNGPTQVLGAYDVDENGVADLVVSDARGTALWFMSGVDGNERIREKSLALGPGGTAAAIRAPYTKGFVDPSCVKP